MILLPSIGGGRGIAVYILMLRFSIVSLCGCAMDCGQRTPDGRWCQWKHLDRYNSHYWRHHHSFSHIITPDLDTRQTHHYR